MMGGMDAGRSGAPIGYARELPRLLWGVSMRLFTAIDLPPAIVESLERLIRTLRPTARIHWSRADNLHITTKFIGEWPEQRLDEVGKALAGLPPRDPLRIEVRGLGWFPNPRSPRVFWAGVEAPAALAGLARDTEAALEPLGIAREERAYSPHLTLARIKTPVPLDPLRQALDRLGPGGFGAFTADSFFLYRSELRPGGSIYTKLASYGLGRGA